MQFLMKHYIEFFGVFFSVEGSCTCVIIDGKEDEPDGSGTGNDFLAAVPTFEDD